MQAFIKRRIEEHSNQVFLTFDDGPCPIWTPKVCEVLQKHGALATFFVVGQKAKAQAPLLQQMIAAGHSIGDHSWDHRYRYFFASEKSLEDWVASGHERLAQLLGKKPVGFRPPAGVITPPLRRVLARRQIPLISWGHRWFDTRFSFTAHKATQAALTLKPGEIALLHDAGNRNSNQFVQSLNTLCSELARRGLRLGAIQPNLIR